MKSSDTTLKAAGSVVIFDSHNLQKYPVHGEDCTLSLTKKDFYLPLVFSPIKNKHLYFCPQKCQGDLCGPRFVSVAYLMLQCTLLTTWNESVVLYVAGRVHCQSNWQIQIQIPGKRISRYSHQSYFHSVVAWIRPTKKNI